MHLIACCVEGLLQPVLQQLEGITSRLEHATLKTRSRTRAASEINAEDLRDFQVAAGVEVDGVESDVSFEDLKTKDPEEGSFQW
jgi:hypothetical protein